MAASPFVSMWKALGEHFHDPRLRQLFGRYATYCGSSPWQAPSTLMLVAHAEQLGVWAPRDGMAGFARRLAACAETAGAHFRYGARAARIEVEHGRVAAVVLDDGERIAADAVLANADPAAIAAGHFGEAPRNVVDAAPADSRSLSAYVWCIVGRARGFPLARHTVFFSGDYRAEFDAIFGRGALPPEPTVYAWAADRRDDGSVPDGDERLMLLANAPAVARAHGMSNHSPYLGTPAQASTRSDDPDLAGYSDRVFSLLARCGLTIDHTENACVVTTPQDFARRFPGSAGALYGQPTHGWRASFTRGGARTRLPGLYLVGGGVHPGAGVPMVALSGRLAAEAAIADFER
jgi:1-hydroxycarotenoid 3,4-desaturase